MSEGLQGMVRVVAMLGSRDGLLSRGEFGVQDDACLLKALKQALDLPLIVLCFSRIKNLLQKSF